MGNPVSGEKGGVFSTSVTSTQNDAQQINPIEGKSNSDALQRNDSSDSILPSGRLRRASEQTDSTPTGNTDSIEQKFSDLTTTEDDDGMFDFDDMDG
jgi:hypothetical protein